MVVGTFRLNLAKRSLRYARSEVSALMTTPICLPSTDEALAKLAKKSFGSQERSVSFGSAIYPSRGWSHPAFE
jgi:hypothetical protein